MSVSGRDPAPVTAAERFAELAGQAWRAGQERVSRGDLADGLRWLERARRLAPDDGVVLFSLATALLRAGEFGPAEPLFAGLAERYDAADAWAGLAACARGRGDLDALVAAVGAALSRHAPSVALGRLAAAAARDSRRPGWCGLDASGVVTASGPGRLALDGRVVTRRLPGGWRGAEALTVEWRGEAFLGSPLRPGVIGRTEGVVWPVAGGGLEGWAWHPADPAREPVLRVLDGTARVVTAREPADIRLADRLFARPRRFSVPGGDWDGMVRVVDAAGRDLLGSPVDPAGEQRAAAALAVAASGRVVAAPRQGSVWAEVRGAAPAVGAARAAVDVVVPVYRGAAVTKACLEQVLRTVGAGVRVWVVDDASPEPALGRVVEQLVAAGRVRRIRHGRNMGFPAAANAGLRAARGRDVVLLNSDTLVAPGWLERLRAAAYAEADVGSVTPLSNDATLASYPAPGSPAPDVAGTVALDRLAWRANGAERVEVPTGVGFCLYMRRDCLEQVGLLREEVFAQGYGEENDWCLRARHLGWRHVVAVGVFVAHVGGQSFGGARGHLLERNLGILGRLHPGYEALIAAHGAADPLLPARRRIEALRWRRGGASAVLVTHGGGGGVDRVVAARRGVLEEGGVRAVVLRPEEGWCVVGEGVPNLRYRMPEEMEELVGLLRGERPGHVELHHLLGHHPALLGLAAALGVPWDVYVHDYAWFCPRIALVQGGRYCGEPDVAGCEACVADFGSNLEEAITVPALLARSAAVLGGARRVVAPSRDAAVRIGRHFPGVSPVVEGWERDGPGPVAGGRVRRVCVVGGIGVEKGYDVLLGCVRDARARGLPLEFVVVGHTSDDERLLAAGPVFVTGRYEEAEAVGLIRAQGAEVGFLPSIWPETWCFALTRAWEAGLGVAVFDLGAQAERVRRTGRGWVLPLGLTPAAINGALLGLRPGS